MINTLVDEGFLARDATRRYILATRWPCRPSPACARPASRRLAGKRHARAAALALAEHPRLNARFGDGVIIEPDTIDVGVAVSAVRTEPVVRDGAIVVGRRMTLTLTCDHRLVYGAHAAAHLAQLLQTPLAL